MKFQGELVAGARKSGMDGPFLASEGCDESPTRRRSLFCDNYGTAGTKSSSIKDIAWLIVRIFNLARGRLKYYSIV